MQVIEQHPYVEQVLSPLPAGDGVGISLAEDAAVDFLENEVMKVGSLAHTSVDWARVESQALKVLADRSKDLRVFGFLMLSLQQGGNGERFALSLYLLHRALDNWWETAWPYPGARGQRARRMLFSQMLQRANKSVESLGFDASVGDGRQFCLDLIGKLRAQARVKELPDEPLCDLHRAVEKLPVVDQVSLNPSLAPPARQAGSENMTVSAARRVDSGHSSAALGNLTLDPGNERATRQSLLKVAELITTTEPGNPLGYRMRRYAIWQSITGLPPTRDGKRTDLAAVSTDRVAEYKEALDRTPDNELWQRIELSLSVSPFWLDGHWLSARAAMALGKTECAEAIREALKVFVERLPQLAELTFNDRTPFLSDEAADWLWASPMATSTAGGHSNPWEQAFNRALELARQSKLAPAMELLEQGLAETREPRDRFYWRLASARLLRETGLTALAKAQLQDLKAQVRELALEDWEPALIKQLERLA